MKKIIGLLAVGSALAITSCGETGNGVAKNVDVKNEKDSISYFIGYDFGKNIKGANFADDLDNDVILAAVNEALEGKDAKIDLNDARMKLSEKLQQKKKELAEKRAAEATQNKEKGEKFLAENSKKEGIKTTKSGLQYEILKEGNGAKPKATDKVKVHYHGTLLDGEVFDSSVDRGQPASFPLNRVIKGWTEGLQLMPVGSKYKFYVPSNLAYGENGSGNKIGGNETLIFEVELLDIEKPTAPRKN